MINNLELIKPLLNFDKKGDFYMLYIFKRKKDQVDKENHQSVRTIKTYCIDSLEYLDKKFEEIVNLSELFKARAYIHVQKQNHYDVGLEMMKELSQRLIDGVYNQKGLFESVVGQLRVYEKRWIVDIDTKDRLTIHHIGAIINSVQPSGDKIIQEIPTKSGSHLITKPFNLDEYRKHPDNKMDLDIQKKNPTLLYYPNSLET